MSPERGSDLDAFAAALRLLLARRGILATGTALERHLRAAGSSPVRNTLQRWLDGDWHPRDKQLEMLYTGLDVSVEERVLLESALRGHAYSSGTVTMQDLLVGEGIGKGRRSESIVWEFTIGAAADGDACIERRLTTAGPPGLLSASLNIAQPKGLAFNPANVAVLQVRAKARRLSDPSKALGAEATILSHDVRRHGYRVVVRFSELIVEGDVVAWTVTYRWPGRWDRLRQTGRSVGRLGISTRFNVPAAGLVVNAPADLFPRFQLLPFDVSARLGTMERTSHDGTLTAEWRVERPPAELFYEVRAAIE